MPATRRPDPEPLETDDVRIIAIGTGLWAVAFLVTLLLHDRLADHGHENWVWVALAGTFLGLIGLPYVVRRRRLLRAEGQVAPAESSAVDERPTG